VSTTWDPGSRSCALRLDDLLLSGPFFFFFLSDIREVLVLCYSIHINPCFDPCTSVILIIVFVSDSHEQTG
jgi:hypothetical protein